MKQEIKIGLNEKDQRLDKFIRKVFKDIELSLIFKDIRKGNIKVNGKKQDIGYKLKENDVLKIFGYHYDLKKNENKKEEYLLSNIDYVKPKICFEDTNVLVVIKDINTLVHSNGDKDVDDLTRNVRTYLMRKGDYVIENSITFSPTPSNRLDRNTYGLVIFGKNNKALNELNEVVRNRKVLKYYRALVEGKVKDGFYKAYIRKDDKRNKSIVSNKKHVDSKEIKMEIKTIDTNGALTLVDINLITGRSHQIRSHFRFIGNPIIGDLKYGSKEMRNYFFNKYGVENQLLFAYKLHFNGIDENMSIGYLNNKVIVMPLPSKFKRIVKQEFKI